MGSARWFLTYSLTQLRWVVVVHQMPLGVPPEVPSLMSGGRYCQGETLLWSSDRTPTRKHFMPAVWLPHSTVSMCAPKNQKEAVWCPSCHSEKSTQIQGKRTNIPPLARENTKELRVYVIIHHGLHTGDTSFTFFHIKNGSIQVIYLIPILYGTKLMHIFDDLSFQNKHFGLLRNGNN